MILLNKKLFISLFIFKFLSNLSSSSHPHSPFFHKKSIFGIYIQSVPEGSPKEARTKPPKIWVYASSKVNRMQINASVGNAVHLY